MKKILLSLIGLTILLFPGIIIAQEASDSAINEAVTQKIKDRLNATATDDLTSVKEELAQKQTSRKKAYLGNIASVNQTNLTLEYKSQIYNVNLDKTTEIVQSAGQKPLTPADLKPNDFILVMGFLTEDKTALTAIRILLLVQPEPPIARQLISGPIQEIDLNKITVSGKILKFDSKTKIIIPGVTNPDTEDFELADNLYAIVTLNSSGNINLVKSAIVIPGKNNPDSLIPTNASESASPSATDSGKIKE